MPLIVFMHLTKYPRYCLYLKKQPISKIKCVNYTIHIMPVLITLSNSLQGVTEWEPSQALEQVF